METNNQTKLPVAPKEEIKVSLLKRGDYTSELSLREDIFENIKILEHNTKTEMNMKTKIFVEFWELKDDMKIKNSRSFFVKDIKEYFDIPFTELRKLFYHKTNDKICFTVTGWSDPSTQNEVWGRTILDTGEELSKTFAAHEVRFVDYKS